MSRNVYFAHPINTYGTYLEKRLLAVITYQFVNQRIINPGVSGHQDGYERWKREMGDGAGYFLNEVFPDCEAVVFLAFSDGKLGAGTAKEVEWFINRSFPVWEVFPSKRIESVYDLNDDRKLSVEETRKRIRDSKGNILSY